MCIEQDIVSDVKLVAKTLSVSQAFQGIKHRLALPVMILVL